MSRKPVWIWLPGQTRPVQAGRFTLQGTAAIPLGSFTYDKAYVERPDRIALDERQLRGFRGTARTTDYQGVFDILRDVVPEGFGLDYPAANDYLDRTWQTVHDRWVSLAQDVDAQPLERPRFALPPRSARMPEKAWSKARAR